LGRTYFLLNSYVHTSETSRTFMRAQVESGSSRQVKKMDAGDGAKWQQLEDQAALWWWLSYFAWLRFRDDPLHKFLVSWETWLWKLVMHRRITMENSRPALLVMMQNRSCTLVFFLVDLCTSFLIERNKHFPILIMRIIHYFLFLIKLEWDFGVCNR